MRLMRRRFLKLLLFTLLSAFFLTGCEQEKGDYLGSVTVLLVLHEGLGDISLDNVQVTLVNLQDNAVRKSFSDPSGMTVFSQVPSGSYNITVTDSREEGAYILSGSLTNILVSMKQTTSINLTVDAISPGSDFVIKEVYFAGTAQPVFFKDQFIEIFNNSSEVLYADGLYVAHLLMHSDWNASEPYSRYLNLEENVYADFVEQIPGNGQDYPVEPGKSIVIALNAMDFREDNPQPERAINLTNASFERYAVNWLESLGRLPNYTFDFNNPDVPNMTPVFLSTNGYNPSFYMMHIAGPSIVIFRREEPITPDDIIVYEYLNQNGAPSEVDVVRIPVPLVMDGVDFLNTADEGQWKRLPTSIDASFNYLRPDGNSSYSFMSLRRKIDPEASNRFGRVVLQTTRNSYVDFQAITAPDPRGYDFVTF